MNKIIVITGTSKGIGKAMALYYLNKNFVVAGCSRSSSSIDDENYRHFELDITDEITDGKLVDMKVDNIPDWLNEYLL